MENLIITTIGFGHFYDFNKDDWKDDWKDEIKRKYAETKNYPRKKKKQARKSLKLDWCFANYEGF